VRRKLADALQPERLTITLDGNVLRVASDAGPRQYGGEIVMSQQRLRSGRGHYSRLLENGDWVWGLWDVQVALDRTLLVHETYAHPETKTAVVSGYLWEPE
jgi:hypothetical protein